MNSKFLHFINLSKSTNKQLVSVCNDLRNEIIEVIERNGGHLSPNLGVIELTVALCKVFDRSKDKFVFDTGHQTYAYKLLCGEGKEFYNLRKQIGSAGFQIKDDQYHHFSAGHAGTALSYASGLAFFEDKNYVICIVGDGSLSNGVTLEAINNLNKIIDKKLVVIFNNNKMSISPSHGLISNEFLLSKDFASFCKKHKIQYFKESDGNDINKLVNLFNKVKKNNGLSIVVVNTIKGKGIKIAEQDKYGAFHSVSANFNVNKEQRPSLPTWTDAINQELLKIHKNPCFITAGMTLGTGISNFSSNLVIDTGIAESHSLLLAAGIADSQKRSPLVMIYSTFLQRAFDQLIHDVCRINYKVDFFINRSGIVGEDGETHHGLYDLNLLLNLGQHVIQFSNLDDIEKLIMKNMKSQKPTFYRFSKQIGKVLPKKMAKTEGANFYLNKVGEVSDIYITYGDLVHELCKTLNGKKVCVVDLYDFGYSINDWSFLKNKNIRVVEELPKNFSFYNFLISKIEKSDFPIKKMKFFGPKDNYLTNKSISEFYSDIIKLID